MNLLQHASQLRSVKRFNVPFFKLPDIKPDLIDKITGLFFCGATLADDMSTTMPNLSFEVWAKEVRSDARIDPSVATSERLAWIWETLRTDADLRIRFSNLEPALSEPEVFQTISVLPAGAKLVIALLGNTADGMVFAKHDSDVAEEVTIKTLETLKMRRGKAHRFECCACDCEVIMKVAEHFSPERESDLLGLPLDKIFVDRNSVIARVISPNQAYMVASRRLEPKRRSHGGRIYDHLVYCGASSKLKLEDIRLQVEAGQWTMPSPIAETGE